MFLPEETPMIKFWIKDGAVGLTQEYLDRVGTLWTIIPKNISQLQEGKIIANIEATKCLVPLRSPVTGTLVSFNEAVLDKPNTLNEHTPLFHYQP